MSPEDIRAASLEALADAFGRHKQKADIHESECDKIKEELLRRGANAARGASFILTISESTSVRLDTKAMRADPKMAKQLAKYEKSSTSTRVTCKPAPTDYEGVD